MSPKVKPTSKAGQGRSQPGFLDRAWVAPSALLILTALIYARSLAVPIHNWDDHIYFFRDERLNRLTAENLWRILTQPFFANFHPITTLTLAFDRAVWGTRVPGFHVTQLAFYAGGILGLYFLFARILGRRAEAFVTAAIFAAHTIHVESVAWLASRKDVVCLFFYAFALLAYVGYADSTKRRWRPYALSVVLAGAAMLSKGYAVIMPAVLFAYDLCFAGRITRRHFIDKVPYVALAAAATLLTIHAQGKESALVQVTLSGADRALRLAEIFAQYAARTLLPVHLSAIYTSGIAPAAGLMSLLGALLALALLVGFFALRRRIPAAAFGMALYVLPLATVMNVFFTLQIWMTDRYLLFPTIGSSLAIVAIAASLYLKRGATMSASARVLRKGLAVAALLVVGLYSALTVARIGVWTSDVNLWSDVLRKQQHLGGSGPVTADELGNLDNRSVVNPGPLISLRQAYDAMGDTAEAGRIRSVVDRVRGRGGVVNEMKFAQEDLTAGRYEDALRRLKPIAEGQTWFAPLALFRMSLAEEGMGNAEASRRTMRRAIELYRAHGQALTDAYFEVGTTEYLRRDFQKAAEWYRLAYQESPREANAALHLGLALEEIGKRPEALELYKKIVTGDLIISPQSKFAIADVYLQMGVATQRLGRPQEALAYFEEALRRSPNHPKRKAILDQIAALRAAPAP